MNFKKILITAGSALTLLAVSSCANYRAMSLATIPQEHHQKNSNLKELSIACKVFNEIDCEKYLGRDVLDEGYQPVQLTITNHSPKNFTFSSKRVSLALADAQEVANSVHTSTAKRVGLYTAGGVVTSGLLFIPAVVDGIKSAEANKQLDNDYNEKAKSSVAIGSFETVNVVLFASLDEEHDLKTFNVTFINQDTKQPVTIEVQAN